MTSKHSRADVDGLVWHTVGVPVGTSGLDLRQPADPDTMAELLNARFADERRLARRSGHLATTVQDGADFPPGGASLGSGQWLYGHGLLVESVAAGAYAGRHHPIAGQARGTFHQDGDVVWTGDRLLQMRAGSPAVGSSKYWNRTGSSTKPYGIPAFLPSMTDLPLPDPSGPLYVNGCLTARYRVVVYPVISSPTSLQARVFDRETGGLLYSGDIAAGIAGKEASVFETNGQLVCVYRNDANSTVYLTHFTGSAWSTPQVVRTGVDAWDICIDPSGFHMLFREGTALRVGKFSGITVQDAPYAFATALNWGGSTPVGSVALGVADNGYLGVLWSSNDGLAFRQFTPSAGVDPDDAAEFLLDATTTTSWTGGLSIVPRKLRFGLASTSTQWVVHACRVPQLGNGTDVWNVSYDPPGGYQKDATNRRYNTQLASKGFRVGDEVFCWLRSDNSGTNFLVSGCTEIRVAGFADDEEGGQPNTLYGGGAMLQHVLPDFADPDGYVRTWTRTRSVVYPYSATFGVLDFLPQLSTAMFGLSTYLSGSAVKNWDGRELADAGFHDYPVAVVGSATQTTGGSLTATGTYRIRVYAVRYNAKGERFVSSALTSAPFTLTSTNNRITWPIATVPSVSTDDIVFEVYRTEAGLSTYYLEGTVKNSLSAKTVSFTTSLDDASLRGLPADPHAAGVGQLSEIEEWGPTGCTLLAAIGDRLWAAGGQVPAGAVEFSKLKEPGEGAGFDPLADYHVVDHGGEAVTSVAGWNNCVVIMQAARLHVINGNDPGPDNYGRGAYQAPQLVVADGAITHVGTIETPVGLMYWSSHGPLVFSGSGAVNFSSPVAPFAETLTPTGVRLDADRSEVVWYTADGHALLVNYLAAPRWSRWTGIYAASANSHAYVTPDGVLMVESADANGDGGRPYALTGSIGWARLEALLQSATRVRYAGIVGEHKGDHTLRLRFFYDDSPLWEEELRWTPTARTYLATVDSVADLTPADVDALEIRDRHGGYGTRTRPARSSCNRIRVEFSDGGSATPSFVPWEITFELGVQPGLGRVPVNTVNTSVSR